MSDPMNPQGPSLNPGGYPPSTGAPEPQRRNTGLLVVGALVALVVVAGGFFLLGSRSSSPEDEANEILAASRSGQSSTTTGASTSSDPAPESTVAGQAPSGGNSGGNSGGGAPAPAPSGPAPVITSFVTPESIDCHNGNNQMFSASWTTTNATKTMISIDGPGLYKNYAPNDSDSFPFGCSSAHTFLLTAYGHDGTTITRSITLQPRNVQMPDTGEDDPAGQSNSTSTVEDDGL